jgi:hypothetical protein
MAVHLLQAILTEGIFTDADKTTKHRLKHRLRTIRTPLFVMRIPFFRVFPCRNTVLPSQTSSSTQDPKPEYSGSKNLQIVSMLFTLA